MGLIYAHPKNPKKDYGKSLFFLKKLTEDFPQSSWTERVKIWSGILQENQKLNETIETLHQVNEKLMRGNVKTEERGGPYESLLRTHRLLAQGDYEEAVKENQKILSLFGQNFPEDEALFNLGLIYAYSGNPKKDYRKSSYFLKKLIKEFPQSFLAEQAKILVGMLQENEKLSRSIEELNQVIEKSKQVDLEIEEKKREKAK
jgi:tetratricopeptide (TPR) repeat protein